VPGILLTSFPLSSDVDNIQDVPRLVLRLLDDRGGG